MMQLPCVMGFCRLRIIFNDIFYHADLPCPALFLFRGFSVTFQVDPISGFLSTTVLDVSRGLSDMFPFVS